MHLACADVLGRIGIGLAKLEARCIKPVTMEHTRHTTETHDEQWQYKTHYGLIISTYLAGKECMAPVRLLQVA